MLVQSGNFALYGSCEFHFQESKRLASLVNCSDQSPLALLSLQYKKLIFFSNVVGSLLPATSSMLCFFLDQNKDYRPEDGFPSSVPKLWNINFVQLCCELSFIQYRSTFASSRILQFLLFLALKLNLFKKIKLPVRVSKFFSKFF
jgi:hypothetical protein